MTVRATVRVLRRNLHRLHALAAAGAGALPGLARRAHHHGLVHHAVAGRNPMRDHAGGRDHDRVIDGAVLGRHHGGAVAGIARIDDRRRAGAARRDQRGVASPAAGAAPTSAAARSNRPSMRPMQQTAPKRPSVTCVFHPLRSRRASARDAPISVSSTLAGGFGALKQRSKFTLRSIVNASSPAHRSVATRSSARSWASRRRHRRRADRTSSRRRGIRAVTAAVRRPPRRAAPRDRSTSAARYGRRRGRPARP